MRHAYPGLENRVRMSSILLATESTRTRVSARVISAVSSAGCKEMPLTCCASSSSSSLYSASPRGPSIACNSVLHR